MCLIVVLGLDCPCWRSIAFQHDAFAGPCAIINLILYCRNFGRRGTVESVLTSCTRINFDVRSYGCVCQMIAHGLVHGHPAENSTAIVRGKWPSNGSGHAAHGLFRAFVVVDYSTKSVWPPYSYIPYNSLARANQVDKVPCCCWSVDLTVYCTKKLRSSISTILMHRVIFFNTFYFNKQYHSDI
jgi:hypothetical protein